MTANVAALKARVERIARDEGRSPLDIIAGLQARAVLAGDEAGLRREYIA